MSSREAGPLQDATEELLSQALPVVLERMRRASTKLSSCARKLTREAEGVGHSVNLARLEDVQTESETLGWILGVLASADGDDLLLARREPFAIALLADVIGEVLASEGRALDPDASCFPDIAARIEDGWRLPWTVGLLVRLAANALPDHAPVRWRFDHGPMRSELVLEATPSEDAAPLLCELETLLPGAQTRIEADGFGMSFPSEWFAPKTGDVPR
jgi:hypothetical protein